MIKLTAKRYSVTINTDVSGAALRKEIQKLAAAILDQAMSDGMVKVSMGVSRDTGESWLRYFGPGHAQQPAWWNMVAPPSSFYPLMLQCVFAITDFDECFPLKGRILAHRDGDAMELAVTINETCSFIIEWDISDQKVERGRCGSEGGSLGDSTAV